MMRYFISKRARRQSAQRGSELAIKQGNYAVTNALESNIDLYRSNRPLRDTGE
jgi:hypothetical protein